MNGKRTRKCLRQVEHTKYTINKKMKFVIWRLLRTMIVDTISVDNTFNFRTYPWSVKFITKKGFIVKFLYLVVIIPFRNSRCRRKFSYIEVDVITCWNHHFESFTVASMIWLPVMEYLCRKWPRICSTCRKHILVPSSFMTYHRVCN